MINPHGQQLRQHLFDQTKRANGARGFWIGDEEANNLRSVDVVGPDGNKTISLQFDTGMTVNLSRKSREASNMQTRVDRHRAAKIIIDHAVFEGKKRIKIHGDDHELSRELYKQAKQAGLGVGVLKMRAKDYVRAMWELHREKRQQASVSSHNTGPANVLPFNRRP